MAENMLEAKDKAKLWGFVVLAALVVLLRRADAFQMGETWLALAIALGGWTWHLQAAYRKARADRSPPRPLTEDPRRTAVVVLIAAVFWYFGWFFGLIAVFAWHRYERKLKKQGGRRPWFAPMVDMALYQSPQLVEKIGQPSLVAMAVGDPPRCQGTAMVKVSDPARFLQTLIAESRTAFEADASERLAEELKRISERALAEVLDSGERELEQIVERWTAAIEREGLRGEAVELRLLDGPVAEPPAPVAAEAVVPAAPEPEPLAAASEPLPDLFAKPAADPFASAARDPLEAFAAGSDSLSALSSGSDGFEEVLAMLQGKKDGETTK